MYGRERGFCTVLRGAVTPLDLTGCQQRELGRYQRYRGGLGGLIGQSHSDVPFIVLSVFPWLYDLVGKYCFFFFFKSICKLPLLHDTD